MPNNDDQLQQQYQEILNKYASSITPSETPKIEVATPIISEPKIEPKIEQAPLYFPPEKTEDRPSNFFKYLFYFSFFIFICVVSAIIYNFLNSQQAPTDSQNIVPTSIPTVSQFCELGDKQIPVGESFPSADSCNTCSCTPNLTIVCTQKACVSPTIKPTTKPVSQKVYKDIKYGYQFECPTTAKYVVEATSVNGNKIPFKQESCTLTDSSVVISVYDNTLVHDFGSVQTQISPNKKYIVTFEGDNDQVISSFKFL